MAYLSIAVEVEALPFQSLDVYVAARELAALVHAARITDAELRDQATRAAKSVFEPLRGLAQRQRPDAPQALRARQRLAPRVGRRGRSRLRHRHPRARACPAGPGARGPREADAPRAREVNGVAVALRLRRFAATLRANGQRTRQRTIRAERRPRARRRHCGAPHRAPRSPERAMFTVSRGARTGRRTAARRRRRREPQAKFRSAAHEPRVRAFRPRDPRRRGARAPTRAWEQSGGAPPTATSTSTPAATTRPAAP